MLPLEKTPLWLDIKRILYGKTNRVRFEYKGIIHTAKEDFDITKILTIDIVRNYVKNIGDEIFLQIMMPLGDYVKRLYPHRQNLEITLKRTSLFEAGQEKNTNDLIDVERYKAVFMYDKNPQVKTTDYDNIDKISLDMSQVLTIEFQLLNRSLEPLRIKTTGGIFTNKNPKEVMVSLLGGESLKVLVDGKPSIDGIDIVEPDNTEKLAHVAIPQGTHITAIPTYIQERMGGIYNAGIGTYLQTYRKKRYWFVYPLYKYTRFKTDKGPKAIFYSTPPYRFPIVERTFRVEGDNVYILAMSTKKYMDKAEADMMNTGIGFRQADARAFMGKPVLVSKDGPVGSRNNLVNEVILKGRDDGLNYAPVSNDRISANPFKQYSLINAKNGANLKFTWYNANPNLLYPGMPCKYVYLENDKVKEINGVILFVHISIDPEQKGVLGVSYYTHCDITIFAEPTFDGETEVYTGDTAFAT